MSFSDDCREFIEANRLLECDVVIVAVSGGPDSMCLLHMLVSITAEHSAGKVPAIVAAHLNHGLRGEESDRDEESVRSYCEQLGVRFFARKTNVAEIAGADGIGIEEAGRKARYVFFDTIAERFETGAQSARVAVAHRREDRAETMLINLFRGSGLDGLCAMEAIRGRIIRPILFASKEQVADYIETNRIPFSIDRSNSENYYTRNKWRNLVLPMIREVSARDPVDALLSAGELLRSDKEYFDIIVEELFESDRTEAQRGVPSLSLRLLRQSHYAVASRLVRRLFFETFGNTKDLERDQVGKILSSAAKNAGNRSLSLSGGICAAFQSGMLFFVADRPPLSGSGEPVLPSVSQECLSAMTFFRKEYLLLDQGLTASRTIEAGDVGREIEVKDTNGGKVLFRVGLINVENPAQVVYNNRIWYYPADDIVGVTIRNAFSSDHIRPAGGLGGKPLRRYFTDRKVPAGIRERMIVAARGEEVLWIPGLVHSKGFTDAISCERYLKEKASASLFSGETGVLCKVTLLTQDDTPASAKG